MRAIIVTVISTALLAACGQSSSFNGAAKKTSMPEPAAEPTADQIVALPEPVVEPIPEVIPVPMPAPVEVSTPEKAVATLNGARWELPCADLASGCANEVGTINKSVELGGEEGEEYLVKLRFRGVVEPMNYKDGAANVTNSYWYEGGLPNNVHYNIYRLTIDKPAAVFYLNAAPIKAHVFAIDYTVEIPMAAKSKVHLFADIQNGNSIANKDKVTAPGVPTGAALDFGQFVQMDVVSVTLKK